MRALLVGVRAPDTTTEAINEHLEELAELCATLELDVADAVVVPVRKAQARYLMGSGNAESICERCRELGAELIVFDDTLTPSQQRNWERLSKVAVIDRQEVILDIFANRAQTREASLQIELARAEYSLPRLKRAWTHLSRQQGGVGVRGGEGEKQIEVDARLVRGRITRLRSDLAGVRRQRAEQRKKRRQLPVPVAAIVGYTNAGKSSLLNRLTRADVFVEDKLFATLDPTTRRLELANNQVLLLSDTVGFIRKLPHGLVESFKATLEEAVTGHFLLHVVDVSSPHFEEHVATTNAVLEEIGAGDKYTLMVFNKIDAIDPEFLLPRLRRQYPHALFVSARTGAGLDRLRAELASVLERDMAPMALRVPQSRYDIVASLHRTSNVLSETYDEEGDVLIEAVVPETCRHDFVSFQVDSPVTA
jgi:GTP-binding protein HflX